ncbi:unnamed protein product [Camellia sinensis]
MGSQPNDALKIERGSKSIAVRGERCTHIFGGETSSMRNCNFVSLCKLLSARRYEGSLVAFELGNSRLFPSLDGLLLENHLLSPLFGAITKRMTAIEEMAGMDVLCSDKTRTLTQNRLTVDRNLIEIWTKTWRIRMPLIQSLLTCLLIQRRHVQTSQKCISFLSIQGIDSDDNWEASWSYDGKEVAVEGSSGKDFTIMKVLPSGVFQYKFIVDGQWRYAPDMPWAQDETGNAYNILDLQIGF